MEQLNLNQLHLGKPWLHRQPRFGQGATLPWRCPCSARWSVPGILPAPWECWWRNSQCQQHSRPRRWSWVQGSHGTRPMASPWKNAEKIQCLIAVVGFPGRNNQFTSDTSDDWDYLVPYSHGNLHPNQLPTATALSHPPGALSSALQIRIRFGILGRIS